MNPLPPQAYTKDTLVQAYSWLQHQSDKIKEVAITPDVLVSLYLKAKMQGDNALERPSIQNFKNELKSLAGMMGEFEVVETSTGPAPAVRMRPPNQGNSVAASASSPTFSAATASGAPAALADSAAPSALEQLDERSLKTIQEVRSRLNLSTEAEALRLLIAVGHGQLKNLMK
jgi:hypothetical protein